MTIPPVLRDGAKMLFGIALGAFGAVLFQQSLPPAEGTPEEKILTLEQSLKKSEQRIRTLEDMNPGGARKSQAGPMDALRKMAQDVRDGKRVNPDEIWKATRPIMRDIAPLFDRMRKKDEARQIDWKVGEMTRKYNLSPEQQSQLREFFKQQSETNAQKWQDMLDNENSTLVDFAKAARKFRPDGNLDGFMESTLQGDKLTEYKTNRGTERLNNVQRDADFKVERLNGIVPLDEAQKDKVFAIMARSSPDYKPEMKFDGMGTDVTNIQPGDSSYNAVRGVLRPDQIQVLDQRRAERRAKAEKEAEEMHMTLPENWDMLEDGELGWAN